MASELDMDELKTHQPCEDCGSSDALTVYEDHTFCFSCQRHTWTNGDRPKLTVVEGLLDAGEFKALGKRRIPETTCRKYGYSVGQDKGIKVQIAPYRDQKNRVVAQKVRT